MRRASLGVFAALVLALPSARADEDPILLTLNEVKTQYRNHRIGEAYTALKRLSELAAAPQFEAVRERLLPALSFYAGAIKFEMRDEAGARDAVETYLRFVPDTTLDPGLYPKRFITFFDKVKAEHSRSEVALSPPELSPGSILGGVLPSYASFALDESAAQGFEADPKWGEGPARFLFVGNEARRWKELRDEDARRRFQDDFWTRRDPNPAIVGNELRREFCRRVQFADANFSTETMRGSVTDRGMVFILMGPPNVVARSDIDPKDDSVGYLRATEERIVSTKVMTRAVRMDAETPRVGAGEKMGRREVWRYRSDRLSHLLPWREMVFEFQTKEGYGAAVLQKEAANLSCLSGMAKILSAPR